ncbi:hypothetical protein [Paenibacillus anaericanus]|uniref:hypothetical protein n=1 Tax=Paenibacillus anaericanus TaxID=170367 RepID=UPI000FC9957C|nr:hypothetical protein [Paenibacillus anaericanus]
MGEATEGRSVKAILSRGNGQLVGVEEALTDVNGYASFNDLMVINNEGDFELTFILDDGITRESIQVICLKKSELLEHVNQ